MKTLFCFGTRPEAIKMAPVIQEFSRRKMNFKVCVTGQHKEMLEQVLTFFQIAPDYDLDLMTQDQSLNSLSATIVQNLDIILQKEQPDLVLVQGDTTTAVISALAAFHQQIKVGHIEAGLRTYNKKSPFPEEVNRQLIGRISNYHFAPTKGAVENLLQEKIEKKNIFFTGNTVVDALNWAMLKIEDRSYRKLQDQFEQQISSEKKLILVTGHRRENLGGGLNSLCEALLEIAETENVQIIFPVHLNPNVRETVQKKMFSVDSILLLEPVSYPLFMWLMKRCDLIISDSGGIQEEVPTFGKPLLVTRDFSERMEGVEAGFSYIVGTERKKIVDKAKELLHEEKQFRQGSNPYGDGKAAVKIVDILTTSMV